MDRTDDRKQSANQRIDLRGLSCPEPVLRAKKALEDECVASIEALVDDEVNVNNLKRLAGSLKLTFNCVSEGKAFKVTLERAAASHQKPGISADHSHEPIDSVHDQSTGSAQSTKVGTVIFLTKDKFSDGDEEFSRNLLILE